MKLNDFYKAINLNIWIYCFIFFCISTVGLCQTNTKEEFDLFDIEYVKGIKIDKINNDSLFQLFNNVNNIDSINTFAYKYALNLDIKNNAILYYEDSLVRFGYKFESESALSLNFIFSHFYLPKGAKMFVYNKEANTVLESYSQSNNQPSLNFATTLFDARAVLFYVELSVNKIDSLALIIESVNHGFVDFFNTNSSLKNGKSGSCQFDINCEIGADWRHIKNSVVRYIYNGSQYCTGVLVNNTANDGTPYLLTANHCIKTNEKAQTAIFYFNYENAECDVNSSINGNYITGASLIATAPNSKLDFSLLKLNVAPPKSFTPVYAGWDVSSGIHSQATCIHHPKGDVKKIAISEFAPISASFVDAYTDFVSNTHWNIRRWLLGTTEGGSSGAPLFNQEKMIIGTLTGGTATCNDPVNDYFQKLSSSWDYYQLSNQQLKTWLDPLNIDVLKCSSFTPYLLDGNPVSNISNTDELFVANFGNKAEGFLTSINEIGMTGFYELFTGVVNKNIYQVNFFVNLPDVQELNYWEFQVLDGSNSNNVIYSKLLSENNYFEPGYVSVFLDSALYVGNSFFVGLEYKHKNANSLMSIYHTNSNNDRGATSYCKIFNDMVDYSILGFDISLAIEAYVTNLPDTISQSFVQPFFMDNNINETKEIITSQLFDFDSVQIFYEWERVEVAFTEQNNFWYGTNEWGFEEIAQRMSLSSPSFLSAVKIGINLAEIKNDDSLVFTVRTDNYSKPDMMVYQFSVSGKDVLSNHYNIFRLPKIVQVDSSFFVGVSLYSDAKLGICQIKNNFEILDDVFFYSDNTWNSYLDFGFNNYLALGVQVSETKYSYFKKKKYYYEIKPEIKDVFNQSEVFLFPVPTESKLTIRFKHKYNFTLSYQIVDSYGQIVDFKDNVFVLGNNYYLDINNYQDGLYYMKISTNDLSEIVKIIKISKK